MEITLMMPLYDNGPVTEAVKNLRYGSWFPGSEDVTPILLSNTTIRVRMVAREMFIMCVDGMDYLVKAHPTCFRVALDHTGD